MEHSIETCRCPIYLENCPECLVFSLDGSGHEPKCDSRNMKSGFRTDIYGKVPMPLLKLRIENPKDVLHVLNKTSGMFEVILLLLVYFGFFSQQWIFFHKK